MVKEIKSKTTEWQPYEADENPLQNYSTEELFALVGTLLPNINEHDIKPLGKIKSELKDSLEALRGRSLETIPTDFDGRVEWPSCIHPIMD